MKPPLEPPKGCQEMPGFIVCVSGSCWLTQGGGVTFNWHDRGIWKTAKAADKAREKFCKTLPE